MSVEVKVYNLEGKEGATLKLKEAVFAVKIKASVVHQVYTALLANARQPWADTKGKGEVRGGGKKPWKQKGTGRARHGSTRSPIWKGGGVVFGPKTDRNYVQKINKKMNQLAVKMCLTDKVLSGQLVVVETLPQDGKSKTLSALRKALTGASRRAVVLTEKLDKNLLKAAKNLEDTKIQRAKDVNVMDLLHNKYVIVSKEALAVLEKRLA